MEEHENELRNNIMSQGRGIQLAGEKPGNELHCTELRACLRCGNPVGVCRARCGAGGHRLSQPSGPPFH